MKISEGLQGQLDRMKKSGSFSVNVLQKQELTELIERIGGRPYTNHRCGTCTRDAMHQLNAFLQQKKTTPVLQVNTVKMTMDKKPEEMSYQELKKTCKEKGIKAGRVGKKELIKLLNDEL